MKHQDTHEAAVATIRAMARDAARRALQASLQSIPFEERELTSDHDLSFDHWVTAIMLSSRAFKLSFSARFTSRVARALVAAGLGQAPEEVKPALAHDNMGEFCNLTVGLCQNSLSLAHSSFTGMSLTTPKSTPSFDLGPEELRNLGRYSDKWLLVFGEHQFLCAFTVEVTDWEVFSTLKDADISKVCVSDGGEVDFL